MQNIAEFFSKTWVAINDALANTTLQWILLIGCGLLAIALLVLTLTRWGHARPIWKCVVLSVVAHLLLIGYMYGTQLISRAPMLQRTEVLSMNIGEPEPEPEIADDAPEILESEPDEAFDATAFVPELEPLDRPAFDSEVDIQSEIPEIAQMPSAFSPQFDTQFKAEQTPFTATPAMIAPKIDTRTVSAPKASVEAEEITFRRRVEVDQPDEVPMLEEGGDFELPRVQPEIDDFEMKPTAESEFDLPPIEAPETIDVFKDNEFATTTPIKNTPDFIPAPPVIEASPKTETIPVERLIRASDGAPMPKLYSLRSKDRVAIASRRGGTAASEQAVQSGLAWLANTQSADGGWDADQHGSGIETRALGHNRDHAGAQADTGITGLALLAFMAAGNTHYEGPYRENVQKGLEYLIRNQASDGRLSGNAKLFASTYCHSMSLLALSESLAVTGDERIKEAVQRGVDYSLRLQNQNDGGWRYQAGDLGDMSQFGWKVLALHSASLGGVETPGGSIELMRKFLAGCTSGNAKGLGSYRAGMQPNETMTAEALLCRYFLESEVDNRTVDEAVGAIFQKLPNEQSVNLYYWYYGTMAMYHTGGEPWRLWNEALQKVLLKRQVVEGQNQGSWAPDGVWGGYGGRVYSTAMATLCLEVYYRHLPIYEARLP